MDENLLGQVAQEISGNMLILDKLGCIGMVGDDLVLAVFVFGGDDLARLLNGVVDVVVQADAHYLGSCLGFPKDIIRSSKWLSGVVVEVGLDGCGGGGHDEEGLSEELRKN